MKRNNFQFN